jgi:phosphoribosylanthranilate isomerase
VSVDVKICGLTRPVDAELAVRLGAARLGVIFAGGPRQIDRAQAREVVHAAAGVPVLAVVRPAEVAALLDLVAATGVRGLQLHGAATDAQVAALASHGIEVWRVAALDPDADVDRVVIGQTAGASVVLVEPRVAGRSGGRGLALDLDRAVQARRALPHTPMALAGGLTPDTVAAAIGRVGPDLVDVSSGVESTPGRKDPTRLARFLEAVRDARSPG